MNFTNFKLPNFNWSRLEIIQMIQYEVYSNPFNGFEGFLYAISKTPLKKSLKKVYTPFLEEAIEGLGDVLKEYGLNEGLLE